MSAPGSRPRILLAPLEVAGYYTSLQRGFRDLGVPCDFVSFFEHPFAYGGETRDSALLRLIRRLNRLQQPPLALPLRLPPLVLLELLKLLWFLGNFLRYDVFIFGFGHSLLNGNLDLPVLRLLGRTVICNVGHGSEARPAWMDGSHQNHDGSERVTLAALVRGTRRRRARLRRLQRWANYLVGAPYSSTQLCTGPQINWYALGTPSNQGGKEPVPTQTAPRDDAAVVRILHAPSHPALKGSVEIEAAVEMLRRRGHAIEFVRISGRPFAEVQAALAECDIVVDQIYSDTPMATFASEAAWFGKPAVVGGYRLPELAPLIPAQMLPPTRLCHPDELEDTIEALIRNPRQRHELGAAAQRFVREQLDVDVVAGRYLRLLSGDIPSDWWLDPAAVVYVHGCGQAESRTRELIREIVARYGSTGLQLSQRPELERAALDFAGTGVDG